ncbi:restriction endonuclease subunit S [Ligilactobacillus salivarius]|uniref:restriction endonuclease subunit S n=3 Tax=Ligilactobacillus salivarius TaxID=1624 RepID=UPI0015C684EB|nr:restriction endonuclease subunit S [Ligilactobacillus salivarius]NXZ96987.1 restriction endonuclease subunit S [Ligilactobacillus salivarius]
MFPTQFTGASFTWERKEFGDVVEFYSGLTYKPENIAQSGTLVIRSSNIHNSQYVNADNVYVKNNIVNSEYVKKQDIVVVVRNGSRNLIGKHALLTSIPHNPSVIGAFMTGIRSSDNQFIETLLNTEQFKREINKNLGATINQITTSQFKKMRFHFSKQKENKQIGVLFTYLDNSINLHEDYLQFLHDFKSFLLQKMFFDNDIPPLLRFNKFIEKWNQCRLNDHAIVTMGQSPNSKNYTNNQTDKILVQGNADLYKNKVLKRVFTTEITKTAIKNDILISVRAPVGDIARNQYESVVIGRGIASIKGNDFLYYQLEKMKNSGFWNKYIAGSTFESITGKDLKNAKIYTTNSDEERKIGNIFSSLTNIIQLQEHKIDSLKKLKQFLLQNMFI